MKWIANFLKKGMIKIPGRGCKITQRTANPEGQKNRHFAVGGFLWLRCHTVSVEIAGCFLGLIHPHRLLAGFRPDAMQVTVETCAIFPEQHHRQGQHASHNGESATHENDMSRKLFIKSIFFSPVVGRKPSPENVKSVTMVKIIPLCL